MDVFLWLSTIFSGIFFDSKFQRHQYSSYSAYLKFNFHFHRMSQGMLLAVKYILYNKMLNLGSEPVPAQFRNNHFPSGHCRRFCFHHEQVIGTCTNGWQHCCK
uniref:Beta-defensin-like domain-containing protein n=1 Tax=Laticauda laticaudata TaxID=8630 RepID=A0A8C5STX9_LATLA